MERKEQACMKPPWPACLAVRENLLPSGIPYIPILIEDIPRYISLSNYEENYIKSVQTIGEILPGAARVVQLQSISSDCEAKVTLSLERLPVHAVYFKDNKGRYIPIWVKRLIFKETFFFFFFLASRTYICFSLRVNTNGIFLYFCMLLFSMYFFVC